MAMRTINYANGVLLKSASDNVYLGNTSTYVNDSEGVLYAQNVNVSGITAESLSLSSDLSVQNVNAQEINGTNIDASSDMSCVNMNASGSLNGNDLDITDGGSFGGSLTVTGDASCNDFQAQHGTFSGNVQGNDGSFGGAMTVTGNISGADYSGDNGTFGADVTVGGTLGVTGDMSGTNASFSEECSADALTAGDNIETKNSLSFTRPDAEISSIQAAVAQFEEAGAGHVTALAEASNDGQNVVYGVDLSEGLTKDALFYLETVHMAKKNDASLSHAGAWKISAVCAYDAGTGNASVVSTSIEQLGLTTDADSAGYDCSISASGSEIHYTDDTGSDNGDDAKLVWHTQLARAHIACSS